MSSWPDAKDLVAMGRSDESRPLVVGNDVYEKGLTNGKLFRFTRKRYLFLNLLHDGVPMEEAAFKCGMALDVAEKFRQSSEAADYLETKSLREVIAREAKDPDRWWAMGYLAMDGKIPMNKIQCEIYKEHGKRVHPCSESNQPPMKVEINISPDALQRSKEHRKAVETQIVEELKHAV